MASIVGKKIGMTQIFDEDGAAIPVTAIRIEPNLVLEKKTQQQHGYEAVVLTSEAVAADRLNKPQRGVFAAKKLPTHRYIKEMRDFGLECEVGDYLGVDVFAEDALVDVSGVSRGKGFQGGMKRHGFSGGEKTHGSKFHRALGSTGNAATPSRTYKGRKMPGRMGAERVTVENLRVAKVLVEQQLLLVVGAVPGVPGARVIVRHSLKRG